MAELAEYQQRLCEEYKQLKERKGKLNVVLHRYEEGTLPFKLTDIQYSIMRKQRIAMILYAECLAERLKLEGINLFWEEL